MKCGLITPVTETHLEAVERAAVSWACREGSTPLEEALAAAGCEAEVCRLIRRRVRRGDFMNQT